MNAKRLYLSLALSLMLALATGLVVAQGVTTPETTTPGRPDVPLGTGFTYQGQLTDPSGHPIDNTCDFQFSLWDDPDAGAQVGPLLTPTGVLVSGGLFTVQLDFGDIFDGAALWLKIAVSCAGDPGYTDLSPRQPLTAAPSALSAATAPWSGLTGVPPGFADNVDNDTTYAAGTGLVLTDTTFSADTGYLDARYTLVGHTHPGRDITSPVDEAINATWATTATYALAAGDAGTLDGQHADAFAPASHGHDSSYWSLTGNAGTIPGTHFLGTTDAVSLTLAVSGTAALRLYPNTFSPNLIGGYSGNWATPGMEGATIGGGGAPPDGSGTPGSNRVTYHFGTVSGGVANIAGGWSATVGGGDFNEAGYQWTTVGGGFGNKATGLAATVCGGDWSTASGQHATVCGGSWNVASHEWATVGGGGGNTASGSGATVGGGDTNRAIDNYCTIGGGYNNLAGSDDGDPTTAPYATVAGGQDNIAGEWHSTVGGGYGNLADSLSTTVAGGTANRAVDNYCTVGGGYNNLAGTVDGDPNSAPYATVGGGDGNQATHHRTTIGGGWQNVASADIATVGGGWQNTASGQYATVGGGENNTASGYFSTVPGGVHNVAQGDWTFAAGRRAKANNEGCFVWADSTDADITSSDSDQFIVRANGGLWFGQATTAITPTIGAGVFISTSTGAYLSTGGTWTNASDRNLKENLAPVDGGEVLARLAEVPIATWNYRTEDPSVRHMGPTAQDFYTAFGLGDGDTSIGTVDADGVALAAIQGLCAENQALKAQVTGLEARLTALEQAHPVSRVSPSTYLPWLLCGGLVVAGGAVAVRRKRGQR